ncbi:MAG: hypothetical protein A3I83_09495 [Methylotenera sp. RIFCSPLOWO2_02_FULL_45_14]|nr:MAG: hypothetical protein A3I83_09495 [Methylotenera sp. RIFCSPLOWO2_02_FULL_45_14]
MTTFVSYSAFDKDKVERLIDDLRAHGVDVWFDQDDLLVGDDLEAKIEVAIMAAKKIIICVSKSFNEKPPTSWVKVELSIAHQRETTEGKNYIVPVRLDRGATIPDEIAKRVYADISSQEKWKMNLPRLVKALKATSPP